MRAAGCLLVAGVLLAGCGPMPDAAGSTTVPEAGAADAVLPRADLILTLRDGGVRFSAPITAGRRTLWVRNEGPHPHRARFARLTQGRSADEARLWLASPHGRRGVSPFRILGETAPLGLTTDELVTLDFAPGTYLLLCPLPVAAQRAPGAAHGLVQVFRVE